MAKGAIDLKAAQRATAERPRYPYSALARFFFRSMDRLAGEETTLVKARLVEALAPIPYRAWERHQHGRMALRYDEREQVLQYRRLVGWARAAQDNEYWHLLIVNEKLRQDATEDPRYMVKPIPFVMLGGYAVLLWVMTRLSRRRSFLLNAEFEDHSEHYYAELIAAHPEWEEQPVASGLVEEYGSFGSWADVFRRLGLDERDHMNASFLFADRPELVVGYAGMPVDKSGEPMAA